MIHRGGSVAVSLVLALALTGLAGAQSPASLRVIRTTPSSSTGPMSTITVTFDRPVAGSLDRTVDPASILRVVPPVRGRIEWSDPVTIRLTPATRLSPATTYTVEVAPSFRAMDGGALAEAYRFTFRVQGPTALAGSPVGERQYWGDIASHILPDQHFDVVYSAPVDLRALSAGAFLEFDAACAGARRIVRLTAK